MIRLPALSLPIVLALGTAPGTAQEPVVRTYSLHDLLAEAPESLPIPIGPALPPFPGQSQSHGGALAAMPNRSAQLFSKGLLEWLRESWKDDPSAAGELVGDVLTLRGAAGTHGRVRDLLHLLGGVTGRTVTLRIHVLPAAAAPSTALLDTDAVRALLGAHPPVRSHRLDVRPDVPALMENGRAVNMLRDYDVEVAERSRISDPKSDVVFLGDRLGLAATPMADGRWWLRWGWSASRAALPFPQRSLTGRGLGVVDLPVVDSALARGATVLALGHGVLFGGRDNPVLLVLEKADQPALRTGNVAAVPLGPLAVAPLVPVPGAQLVTRPGSDPNMSVSWPTLPDLYRVLGMHLGTDLGEQTDLTVLGTHAVVHAPGLAQRVEGLARQQAEEVAAHALRFAVGTLPRQDVAGLAADALAARLGTGSGALTLPDQAFALESWTEQAFVRDYEVEIAARSEAVNPVIDVVRAGWSVRGKLHRGTGGVPALSGRFQWARLPSIPTRDSGIQEIGSLDFPEVCFTETDLRAVLDPGTWQVLHQGPDPEAPDERVLVLMVRAERSER